MPDLTKKSIGLALSGGGARGITHLGVLKAMQEQGVPIQWIAGTSAGSIVGALFCAGYSPEEILEQIISTSFFKVLRPSWTFTGLLDMTKIGDLLRSLITEDNFSSLRPKLIIAATDVRKAETVYFSEGSLIDAILCSSCIPVIFKPYGRNGSHYIDGGVLDNLPALPLVDKCDYVIGSNCNSISKEFDSFNMKSLLERTMLMTTGVNINQSKKLCDLIIEPKEAQNFGGFDVNHAEQLFEAGYEEARKVLKENFSSSFAGE